MTDTPKPSVEETIAAYVERMTRCYQKAGGGHPSEELVAAWRAIPSRLRDREPAGVISRLVTDLAVAHNKLAALAPYLSHRGDCAWLTWDCRAKPCSCGLAELEKTP
jgi:hypothetical protein